VREKQKILKARVSQADAGKLYDRLAGVYDIWSYLTEAHARKRSLELADMRDGQAILEVAVGTGLAFVEMVKLQLAGCSNYELFVANALDIPAEDQSFDVLLNNYLFDLLEEDDWPRVLKEFYRVLKPGGKLVVVYMTFGQKLGSGIYQKLYRLSPSLMGGCRGIRLSGHPETHGFEVKVRQYVQQFFFPSEVLLATKTITPLTNSND
jgi:ubiquinone/menaquinone biosynthesis C-methylase UbiE